MTVIGIDLGTANLRVAALIEGAPRLIATVPATVGFAGAAVRAGAAARALRADQRVDVVADHLARPAASGVAGIAWPVLDGRARSPVELVAHLIRTAVVEVEARHGEVVGAVVAVPLALGAVERRVVRDAVLAAGVPVVRLVAAPACAAMALDDDRPNRLLVIDLGARQVRAAVVEHVDGMIDVVGHAAGALDDDDDDPCARALAAAAVVPEGLADAVVIGGGTREATRVARVLWPYRHAARAVEAPEAVVARGAALLARMFVDAPAAVTVDLIEPGLSLGAGATLTPMIPTGAIAPTREVRLIARERIDRPAIELELWEDTAPPRLYGRYQITGLPTGGGAIAACEVTVDVDRVPRVDASDMVNGGALAVTPLEEVGLGAEALAALRAVVTARS